MKHRLSADTIASNYWALVTVLVGVILSVGLLTLNLKAGQGKLQRLLLLDWLYPCGILLLSGSQLYRALQYEVTLCGDELLIASLFGKSHCYSTQQFLGFEQTKRPYSPLSLRLQDGQQFAFFPKLKTEALSIRYVPVADFIAYWTDRLQNPAQAESGAWPDDFME